MTYNIPTFQTNLHFYYYTSIPFFPQIRDHHDRCSEKSPSENLFIPNQKRTILPQQHYKGAQDDKERRFTPLKNADELGNESLSQPLDRDGLSDHSYVLFDKRFKK